MLPDQLFYNTGIYTYTFSISQLAWKCVNGTRRPLCSFSLGEVPIGDLATVHEYGVATGLQSLDNVSEKVDAVSYA